MKKFEFENCSPEKLGVSSKWIEKFLDRLEEKKICMHSFLMLKEGKIIAEGYWKPFDKDQLHRMYSVSKTFVSAAIGILSDQGKISLEDKIVDYFPDKLPEGELHPYVKEMTIRDLLMMATPHSCGTTYKFTDKDWVQTFFNAEADHPSGSVFLYDTSGTYILDVIVERVTGKPFMEYLKDHMLREIGFSENAWCVKAPEGYSWGGSGVMATTRDLAKFASVFLNGGKFNGKQLISKEYVKAATTKQIFNDTAGTGHRTNSGYGYQIWIMEDGAFAFKGMGSQQAICIPEKDFLFVCTADTQGSPLHYEALYDYLWFEVVEKISGELAEDRAAYEHLAKRCESLAFLPLDGNTDSEIREKINGVTYILNENPMQISKLRVEFDKDTGILNYTTPRGDKKLHFGIKHYLEGYFPETHYSGHTIGIPANRMYKSTSCGVWFDKTQFVIRTYVIDDYFGNLTIVLSFKNDEIGVRMQKNAEWFLDEYQGFAGGKIGDSSQF